MTQLPEPKPQLLRAVSKPESVSQSEINNARPVYIDGMSSGGSGGSEPATPTTAKVMYCGIQADVFGGGISLTRISSEEWNGLELLTGHARDLPLELMDMGLDTPIPVYMTTIPDDFPESNSSSGQTVGTVIVGGPEIGTLLATVNVVITQMGNDRTLLVGVTAVEGANLEDLGGKKVSFSF